MGEGLAGLDLTVEGQEDRADGVLGATVRDDHLQHRLGGVRNRIPDAQRLQHRPASGRHRIGAVIGAGRGRQCRIGQDHREIRAQPLLQRERQCQSGDAAARDDDAHGTAALLDSHIVLLSAPT